MYQPGRRSDQAERPPGVKVPLRCAAMDSGYHLSGMGAEPASTTTNGATRDRWVGRAVLALGAVQLALGVWMAAAPRSFFDVIGGFGAFNGHYVRDVSTFYLALGIALVLAWRRPAWRVPVLWVAVLEYGFHVVNHLVDVGDASPSWVGPFDAVTLALGAGAFAALLGAMRRRTAG